MVGDGYWQAVVLHTEDDNYSLHLEAYRADGLEATYNSVHCTTECCPV